MSAFFNFNCAVELLISKRPASLPCVMTYVKVSASGSVPVTAEPIIVPSGEFSTKLKATVETICGGLLASNTLIVSSLHVLRLSCSFGALNPLSSTQTVMAYPGTLISKYGLTLPSVGPRFKYN